MTLADLRTTSPELLQAEALAPTALLLNGGGGGGSAASKDSTEGTIVRALAAARRAATDAAVRNRIDLSAGAPPIIGLVDEDDDEVGAGSHFAQRYEHRGDGDGDADADVGDRHAASWDVDLFGLSCVLPCAAAARERSQALSLIHI